MLSSPPARAATTPKIRAIALDAFTTFDPRSVFALAEDLFPGTGTELSNAWRTRQFEYTWLRTLTGSYVDFWHVTEDALVYAAKLVKIELTVEKRNQLMQAFLSLKTWPDALPALQSLKASGMRMALLSNFTAALRSGTPACKASSKRSSAPTGLELTNPPRVLIRWVLTRLG